MIRKPVISTLNHVMANLGSLRPKAGDTLQWGTDLRRGPDDSGADGSGQRTQVTFLSPSQPDPQIWFDPKTSVRCPGNRSHPDARV